MTIYDIEVAADLAQDYNELSEAWLEGEQGQPAPKDEPEDNKEPF